MTTATNPLTAEQIAGIKACPFCGNLPCDVPQNSSRPNGPGWWLFVWCEECNAQGPHRSTDEAAIAAWNRRAAASLPEGYALVPIEPTGEMWVAGRKAYEAEAEKYRAADTTAMAMAHADRAPEHIYRAMIAASPAIPTARDGGGEAAEPVWPDFIAPPKYPNAGSEWTDPDLPDFRTIWQVARECGYAVGLHGSMKRDCDLIAAPWVADAKSPDELVAELCKALNAREVGPREAKPNGRIALNLQVDGWVKLIDLSIMLAASPVASDRGNDTTDTLQVIAALKGKTLISVEYGQPYSIGANAAFEQAADLARAALSNGAQP